MASKVARLKSFFGFNALRLLTAKERRWLLAILVVHYLLCACFILPLDFTSDESPYQGYAWRWLKGYPERVNIVDDSKSPVTFFALAPALLKPVWPDETDPHGFRFLRVGRLLMFPYVVLAALVLVLWMRRLWGAFSWVIPLLFFLFDPTVFVCALLVHSDIASMSLLLLCLYLGWRYAETRQPVYWWRLSLAVGLAMVAKASLVYVLPLLALLLAVQRLFNKEPLVGPIKPFALRWAGMLLVVLLVINVAYYFHHAFFPVGQMPQRSQAFQHLVQALQPIRHWLVPLPYDYVSGFDLLQYNAERGGGPYPYYSFVGVNILGKYFSKGPVWYYYIVSLWWKLPALVLISVGAALLWWWRSRQRWLYTRRYWFVWMPALVFFLILSLTNPFQIGVRHALLIFPMFYMGTAPVMNWCWQHIRRLWLAAVLATLALWVSFWPNMIAYTNELLWPKRSVYKYLYHSTISHGHTGKYQVEFMKRNPEFQSADSVPRTGHFAVSLETLMHPFDVDKIAWLRNNFEPYGTYRGTILLYHITPAQLQQFRQRQSAKHAAK